MHTIFRPLAAAVLASLAAGCGTLSAYNAGFHRPAPGDARPDGAGGLGPQTTDGDGGGGPSDTDLPAAPAVLTDPTVTGDPTVGSTLTADPGTWSGTEPIVHAWQWQRCAPDGTGCADLPGATGTTYVATADDILHAVLVRVMTSNELGSAEASSDPVRVTFRPGTVCDDSGGAYRRPERLEHVLVFVMAERAADEVDGGSAPYFDGLVGQCGSSSAYVDGLFDADLPSLPHYLALTSGSNCEVGLGEDGEGCITENIAPDDDQLDTVSIFGQVASWKSYQEDMPATCDGGNPAPGTNYDVKHNPAAFYSTLAGECDLYDVPIARIACSDVPGTPCEAPANELVEDLADDTLPELAFVTPDLQNDTHDAGVGTGDNWLQAWLPLVLSSPAYLRGGTAVYVVWDKQGTPDGGPMPNLFVSPFVEPLRSDVQMNHFATLRAIEAQLGITAYLGCASGTQPGGGDCPDGSTADLRSIFAF